MNQLSMSVSLLQVTILRATIVHRLFEEQVDRNADAIAISFQGEQVSYASLNNRSNQITHALIRMGLRTSHTVAVMLDDGPQQIASLFGVMKAGGVILCLDQNFPTNRLVYILEEAAPPYLIVGSECANRHQALLQRLAQFNCDLLILDGTNIVPQRPNLGDKREIANLPNDCPITNPNVSMNSAEPIYIVYTSSSTGNPKGIVQSHRSFHQYIAWQSNQFGIKALVCFDHI